MRRPRKRTSPAVGRINPLKRAQQRRLARAVGAEDSDKLAVANLERGVADHGRGAVTGRERAYRQQRRIAGGKRALPPALGLTACPEVGLTHRGRRRDFVRRPLADLGAGVEHDDAARHAHHQFHVMLDQNDREADGGKLAEHFVDQRRVRGVETGGRFVERQHVVKQYSWAIDLEICVFPQEGLLNNPGTDELMVAALDRGCRVVGGAPYTDSNPPGQIDRVFELARDYDIDIDMHQRSSSQFVHSVNSASFLSAGQPIGNRLARRFLAPLARNRNQHRLACRGHTVGGPGDERHATGRCRSSLAARKDHEMRSGGALTREERAPCVGEQGCKLASLKSSGENAVLDLCELGAGRPVRRGRIQQAL